MTIVSKLERAWRTLRRRLRNEAQSPTAHTTTSLSVPEPPKCVVRLDRWSFVSPREGRQSRGKVPSIPGFKIVRDTFVRRQGRVLTYRRVRSLENSKTGTKVFIQYDRAHGWLKPFLVTMVGKDATGIPWPDLKQFGDAFGDILSRMVELSFDFAPSSGVNREFVLKHALFGKSRPAHNTKFQGLRYGTRRSKKFVRCYSKHSVDAYRVELEFHSPYLTLPQTDCLLYLMSVGRSDFQFVRVDWNALDSHLRVKVPGGAQAPATARSHYGSLHELLQHLRSVGVNNPHRFLRPLRTNSLIDAALDEWRNSLSPRVRNRRSDEDDDD